MLENSNSNLPSNDKLYIKNDSKEKEKLKQYFFTKFSKKENDSITKNDIISFLEDNSATGTFDHTFISRIFTSLKLNDQNSIKLIDFINQYFILIEEIKSNLNNFSLQITELSNELREQDIHANQYKNEQLNADGLSNNSKLLVSLLSIVFSQKPELQQFLEQYFYFKFSISKGKDYKTQSFNKNNANFPENYTFEFDGFKKNDILNVELYNSQNSLIRELNVEIMQFMGSDEIIMLDVEIPTEDSEDVLLVAKLQIQCIASLYQFFAGNVLKCNEEIEKIKNEYTKYHNYLIALTDLKCFKYNKNVSEVNSANYISISAKNNWETNDNYNTNNTNNIYLDNANKNIYEANLVDNEDINYNNLREKRSYENNLSLLPKNKVRLVILAFFLSLFNLILFKNDFVNAICTASIVFFLFNPGRPLNVGYEIKKIIYALFILSFIFDIFWLFFKLAPTFIEGFLGKIVVIVTFINLGVKSVALITNK